MAKPKRVYVIVAFDVAAMCWRPLYRTDDAKRGRALLDPLVRYVAGWFDLWSFAGDVEDVEAVETMCAEIPRLGLGDVFEAFADVADHAFTLGGGRFVRELPEVKPAGKSVH